MSDERSRHTRSESADMKEREMQRASRLEEEIQSDLDEALEQTFPASDPPSMTVPKIRIGSPKRGPREK